MLFHVDAAQKNAEKARAHAALQQGRYEEFRNIVFDALRALPKNVADEIAAKHGDTGAWALKKAMEKA